MPAGRATPSCFQTSPAGNQMAEPASLTGQPSGLVVLCGVSNENGMSSFSMTDAWGLV